MTKLAVLGSPIAHSKSPALHLAAYRALGLDWSYEAIELTSDALSDFVQSRGPDWRGLSLTMPLKRSVLPLLTGIDRFSELTGAANTLLLDGTHRRGFNTDVVGIVESFRAAGIDELASVRILGGGATAASALVAASRLGASMAVLVVRSPDRIGPLVSLAEELDVTLTVDTLGASGAGQVDAVVSTLPHGSGHVEAPIAGAVLFDVAYEPWPTPTASAWVAAGCTVISGIELLTRQALAQVQIFVNGSIDTPLEEESRVFAAMRTAVGLSA